MKKSKDKKNSKIQTKNVLKNNLYLWKICFQTDSKYILLFILDVIRDDINYFLEYAWGLNFVLECVEYKKPITYPIGYLVFLFLFVSLGMIYSAWFNEKYKLMMLPKIKASFKQTLFQKAKEVELEYYDNPEYYNNFIFSISESDKQIDRGFELIQKTVSCMANLLLIGGFFIVQDAVSLCFVALIFGSSFVLNKIAGKLEYQIRMKKNLFERKKDYVNRTFYMQDYAKEIRTNTELGNMLLQEFEQTNSKVYEIEKENAGKRFWLSFLREYVSGTLIHDVIYMLYLLYRAVVMKAISYSNVVVLYKTAGRMRGSMQNLATLYPFAMETSLYVDKIKQFLDMPVQIVSEGDLDVPEKPSLLELKNVYFSYASDDNYVLKNINMKIRIPSRIAIVGFNGAGKTTLIKLIMRLYDVTKGEILLDGVNIKNYKLEEYRQKIGVVFQDFKLYAATVAENVVMDDVKEQKDEMIVEALKQSDFYERLQTLPNGINTELTKEFDENGVNLSGGESQKLAVSRGFYYNTPIAILDEPSSALDPISEYKLNKFMMTKTEDKLVIFISHRLSTTRLSDCIYVLGNGQLIEYGKHDELLHNKTTYREMWDVQAGQYN